jgi:hypothetical protein
MDGWKGEWKEGSKGRTRFWYDRKEGRDGGDGRKQDVGKLRKYIKEGRKEDQGRKIGREKGRKEGVTADSY